MGSPHQSNVALTDGAETSERQVAANNSMPRGSPSPPPAHLTGSDGKPRRRLLKRSHHTICTMKGKTEKFKNGYKMDYYISYVFGGLIQEADGRFCPTNDLLEIVSKNVLVDKA